MSFSALHLLLSVVVAALFAYLIYSTLRPEDFE